MGAKEGAFSKKPHVYSFYRLPHQTDPLWISSQLKKLTSADVLIRLDGIDQRRVKKMGERARRQNAQAGGIANIDSAVSFEESSEVLEGLSRGTEEVIRISLILASENPLDLDPDYFCREKNTELPYRAISGERVRHHRPHFVRIKTAADLIPTFLDPMEEGTPLLKSRRGFPLYFSPLDARLDSLHWLVAGATGAGKSFFTGLIFKRLLEQKENVSVLFIDHRRSYRRLCQRYGLYYLEPENLDELRNFPIDALNLPQVMMGVELSNLLQKDKKEAARFVLEAVQAFLTRRKSSHTIFVVLDECWNFLRDEPLLVQTAFREYRKLQGAICVVTQSVNDALKTANGEVIMQCAPIRVLLRQGEDMAPLQGVLNLNSIELREARRLSQRRGEYSECLLKTPFSSTIGRLYPTAEEFELLRTDNLRSDT